MANMNTDTPATAFSAVLSQLRRGQAEADLTDALRELVQRVRETRKKGSLTLKLTVQPQSKGDDVVLILSDDVKTNLPVAERGSSIFYADEQNRLVRNDPRQSELRLEVLPGAPATPTASPLARAN